MNYCVFCSTKTCFLLILYNTINIIFSVFFLVFDYLDEIPGIFHVPGDFSGYVNLYLEFSPGINFATWKSQNIFRVRVTTRKFFQVPMIFIILPGNYKFKFNLTCFSI